MTGAEIIILAVGALTAIALAKLRVTGLALLVLLAFGLAAVVIHGVRSDWAAYEVLGGAIGWTIFVWVLARPAVSR